MLRQPATRQGMHSWLLTLCAVAAAASRAVSSSQQAMLVQMSSTKTISNSSREGDHSRMTGALRTHLVL
jgi:hypothetical protein